LKLIISAAAGLCKVRKFTLKITVYSITIHLKAENVLEVGSMTEEEQSLIDAGIYLLNHRLAWGTSGNMSARMDDDTFLITASGTQMGALQAGDFAICECATGRVLGERKPSKELPMHLGIYQNRPDARMILHSSPFYTTMLACSDLELHSELFIESMYYMEHIAWVDYYHPGTVELGEAVKEQSQFANVIMMRNHGVIVFDDNLSDTLMRLETLEMVCRMTVEAASAGVKLNRLPEQTVSRFLNQAKYKPRKTLRGV
jgi:L-fuculose-phosphate aldolase